MHTSLFRRLRPSGDSYWIGIPLVGAAVIYGLALWLFGSIVPGPLAMGIADHQRLLALQIVREVTFNGATASSGQTLARQFDDVLAALQTMTQPSGHELSSGIEGARG